jgi:hypothetical protein
MTAASRRSSAPFVWLESAQIKSHEAYLNRTMLTAQEVLVGMWVKLENAVQGLLKTFDLVDRARLIAEGVVNHERAERAGLTP